VKNNLDAYRGEYPGRQALLTLFVFEDITSVDVVDDLTLTVTTARPWATFPAYLSGRIGIIAQAQLDDADTCDTNLIGTGPFELEDWIVGEELIATRYDDYWRTDAEGNQLPYLDAVAFRPYIDPTARTNALLSGDIQAMHTPTPEETATLLAEEETGMPLEFSQTILANPASQAVAQFYQDQAAQVGIESTIESVDQSAEINTALGDDWQVLNWRNHPGDDPDTQYIWWYGGYPTNFNKFDDPEINALLDEGRSESDPARRREIYEELNREFARELYNIWMIWTRWTVATATDVYGLSGPPLPDGSEPNPGLADGHPVSGMWLAG
jgi:ABC-type transport system substrate-binding protein